MRAVCCSTRREKGTTAEPRRPSREDLVRGSDPRRREQELTGEDAAEVDAYFGPDFAFHGPDGAEMDYEGLKAFFASQRAAFDDLTNSRGIIFVG